MTRDSILSENSVVSRKFAKAILLRFLQENRCVEEFVNSYNFQHNTSFNCDQVVRRCINVVMCEWDGYLDSIFNFGRISFSWFECEHIKSSDFWAQINAKWKALVEDIMISD